jgi:hypothetical protein
MSISINRVAGGALVAVVTALAGVSPAVAATHKTHAKRHATRHARHHASNTSSTTKETALTGATLTSASTAATTANPGATVDSASTETDSSLTGAAYEVHITKADGSKAVVIEDSSFTVLATQAGGGPGGHGH